jgi:hypothetical protein
MLRVGTVLMLWLASAVTASAQILLTAETGGAGSQAVTVSANRIAPKDFGTLDNFWAQYGYGLTDRADVFGLYGNISVFGDTQHYVGAGTNISVLRRDRAGIDVSFFGSVSAPVTRRDEAAAVLGTLALIGSRPIQFGSFVVTPYGGIETVAPAGHRDRGIFTPVETLHAGIVGAAVPVRKDWTAYFEYNPGSNLRSAGAGITVAFPRQRLGRP